MTSKFVDIIFYAIIIKNMEASNTANFPFFNMCWSKACYKTFEINSAEPFHSQETDQ